MIGLPLWDIVSRNLAQSGAHNHTRPMSRRFLRTSLFLDTF